MKLILPTFALRMVPNSLSGRERPGRYHFQKLDRKNKTVCGIIIADWRGDLHTNKAYARQVKMRERWQRKNINDVPAGQMCGTCLGAIKAER